MYGSVTCSFIDEPYRLLPKQTAGWLNNTIYLYQANKANLLRFYDYFNSLLNADEQAKAARYYQTTDRQRYVLQHSLLRLLLGRYLSIDPTGLSFTVNANKKPYLNGITQSCYFNISHSGDEMLLAVGDKELGIDIEQINTHFEYRDIAAQYFSGEELEFINASANPAQAFFLLWTRKEALLKACGTGIDDNLPLMPALNGTHQLPGSYPAVNWLTESFFADRNSMASITYPEPETNIVLQEIDASWVNLMLNNQ